MPVPSLAKRCGSENGNAVPAGPRNGAKKLAADQNRRDGEYPAGAEKAIQPTKAKGTSRYESLPFVARGGHDGRPLNFWSVTPSGDMAKDGARGRAYAQAAILSMQHDGFTPLLGWIAGDMAHAGPLGDIEFAFWDTIAREVVK